MASQAAATLEGLVEDEDEEGKAMWDNIAEHMWRDYQDYMVEGDSEEYESSEEE